ncbi:MAG: hypothetical protein K0R18_443 [Bacillales bacterium]|jgi:hypothetical protein|nr:hypothetical protein [Bacillales bacterium]
MSNKDDKDLKSKLVLLPGASKSKQQPDVQIELTDEEKEIKARLIEIEKKIDSLEKIVESINGDLPETFYASEVFFTIIAGAALSAASEVVNEVFGIKKDSKNPLL